MSTRQRTQDSHEPGGRRTYSPRLFSVCVDARGRRWAAWQATEGALEVIRVLSPEVCPATEVLSAPGLHFEPILAATPDGDLWCAWSSRVGGQWRLVARCREDDWSAPVPAPADSEFVFHIAGTCDAAGRLWVSYATWNAGEAPKIACRMFDGRSWSPQVSFDDLPRPQMRPRIALSGDGVVWLAFCAYLDQAFRIVTVRLSPDAPEKSEMVTVAGGDPEDWDLFPTLSIDAGGTPWLAWVTCADVEREGVVGRQTTLNCARWDGSRWKPTPGGDDFAVTHLDWGMLPVETYWGYSGLRRRPQLAADRSGMWLLWERHRAERGVPENVANGQFCGKYHDGRRWSEAYLVYDASSCFTVDSVGLQPEDALSFACKTAPADDPIDITFVRRLRSEFRPLEEYPAKLWAGWRRVDLPSAVVGPRREFATTCGGETFELIWGDLHCHSYYSPDAEGEPLELLLYARDRGALDFCAIMDNDYYPDIVASRSLLDYLYAVAHSFDDTRFAAFWGWEYTYHPPDGGRFPKNHRAVVCFERDQPLARRCDEEGSSAEAFIRTMQGSATFWHPHHEEWELFGHVQEENVEVCAGWFDYMQASDVVQRHLKAGFRFGFTGASDNHRIVPGMGGAVTGLYVRHRSREGIVEALQHRRCYATTGCRLILDFRVNDHMMGSVLESTGKPRLYIEVHAQRKLASLRVLRDEQVIAERTPAAPDCKWEYEDQTAKPAEVFTGIELRFKKRAKSSSFLTILPRQLDRWLIRVRYGCTCCEKPKHNRCCFM